MKTSIDLPEFCIRTSEPSEKFQYTARQRSRAVSTLRLLVAHDDCALYFRQTSA